MQAQADLVAQAYNLRNSKVYGYMLQAQGLPGLHEQLNKTVIKIK